MTDALQISTLQRFLPVIHTLCQRPARYYEIILSADENVPPSVRGSVWPDTRDRGPGRWGQQGPCAFCGKELHPEDIEPLPPHTEHTKYLAPTVVSRDTWELLPANIQDQILEECAVFIQDEYPAEGWLEAHR